MPDIRVPFFRPQIGQREVDEVTSTLRSGWLTSGPKVKLFEKKFAAAVGATYAVAVNSCTAALHLAVEAMGLQRGQAVLVPTMTFAATAEVVRYHDAIPVLVDCDPVTSNMNLDDALSKTHLPVVGILPVHVGGLMMDVEALNGFARRHGLWLVEDAAHAFPAAWRKDPSQPWQRCGDGTSAVTCFSFYANKTITTGEGGMAVTNDDLLAQRLRTMSLHGLSHDAWNRYSGNGSWDYQIVAPGYKYNLTDIAASIGLCQLARAEEMRREREAIARHYIRALADVTEIELPPVDENRIHSWHLFPLKLRLDHLSICRDSFIKKLKRSGITCSVHWRPLHLHPYYREKFGWQPHDFPVATSEWKRLVSLPIYPGMREMEIRHVIETVKSVCFASARRRTVGRTDVGNESSSTYARYAPGMSNV
jgi:dTDP-4-amino-4,6-dideoxygalactose transaminase